MAREGKLSPSCHRRPCVALFQIQPDECDGTSYVMTFKSARVNPYPDLEMSNRQFVRRLVSRLRLCVLFTLSIAMAEGEEPSTPKPELMLQTGHAGVVTGVAFDPQGEVLATVGLDNTLKVWSATEGVLLQSLDVAQFWRSVLPAQKLRFAGYTSSVTFLPNGAIVTASSAGLVLWHPGVGNHYFL